MKISDCCGFEILGETVGKGCDEIGVCSKCKEWANVVYEDEDVCPNCGGHVETGEYHGFCSGTCEEQYYGHNRPIRK